MKKFLSVLLMLCLVFSLSVIPASAEEAATYENIEIIILNEDISDETKEKIIAFYSDPESQDNTTATYGLTCTLFGHKLETSYVYSVTHKARATAPRCLEKTHEYSACTRCDYETSTVISSGYIYCCA